MYYCEILKFLLILPINRTTNRAYILLLVFGGTMIFSKTVTASELRDKLKDFLSDVTGRNVLQVLHRGQPVRVIMTQDHYLALLGKIAAFESSTGQKTVPHKTASTLGQKVAEAAEHILEHDERPRKKSVENG